MGSKRKRGAKIAPAESQPSQKRRKSSRVAPVAPVGATSGADLDLDKSPFSEKVTNEDRRREARIYDLLGSADDIERITAAEALVTGLLASDEYVLERHLEKRLFRGLASSRNASRVGFSLVLTELLGQLFGPKNLCELKFPGLTFGKVLNILIEKTEAAGNLPGQEERDCCFGQLFGLQCFVESKILFFGVESRWPTVLDLLLKLSKKKVWLRSQCAWLIVDALPQMGQKKAQDTLHTLVDIGLDKSTEGVGIWLKAASCYPKMKLLAQTWKSPLAPENLPNLANVLKESARQDTSSEDTMKVKQSMWTPQLHFVWDLLMAHFVEPRNSGLFKAFWSTVVDDALFSKTATDAQKFRGFTVFQKFLQGFAAKKETALIKGLFSRNLMKCLLNQASKEDRYLHRAALKTLKTIEQTVEAEPAMLLPVLKQLFGKYGAYDFDQRTNTKTIEKLLQCTIPAQVDAIRQVLRDPITNMEGCDRDEVENLRLVYAGYVFKMCIQVKASTEGVDDAHEENGSILELTISEMIKCAYSMAAAEFHPALSEKTRECFRGRLASALARVTKRHQDFRYVCDAVLSVEPTAVKMDRELEDVLKYAKKSLKKLVKASMKSEDEQAASSLGLALLYATTILQLYDGDSDAVNVLDDLKQCAEKMKEADAAASALLVDILLSLVSRPSPLMRQMSRQVLEAFTAQLSDDALDRLTEPLEAEENLTGQQSLFDADGDEDMVDAEDSETEHDEDEEGSEMGSDVELVALNGAESEDLETDGDGDEESQVADDGTNGTAEEYAKLDETLARVLGSHRLDQDEDGDSSDDSDMSDSEMLALDEKLAEVFRHQVTKTSKRKEGKGAKEMMINFKHRVLDLLHIYVKKEALNPSAFKLLLPLLRLHRTTATKALAHKAAQLILDFSNAFKRGKSSVAEVQIKPDVQLELLHEIHAESSKDPSHAFAKAVSTASLLVVSSLFAADKGSIRQISQLYATSQADWTMGKVRIQPSFFLDWVNWCQGQASNANA